MLPPLPDGFVELEKAQQRIGSSGNIIGLVVDVLERTRNVKTGSYFVTFTLKVDDFSARSWEGYKVRYFNQLEHKVPIVRVGDVFLIRGIRVSLDLASARADSDRLTVSVVRQ